MINKVRYTFFEHDSVDPSYMMERGGVMRPYRIGDRVAYFTDDQIKTFEKEHVTPKIEAENKKVKTNYNFNNWLRKKLGLC